MVLIQDGPSEEVAFVRPTCEARRPLEHDVPALSFGFFLAKLLKSVQVPFALGTGRTTVLRFVPRPVDICRAHHLDF